MLLVLALAVVELLLEPPELELVAAPPVVEVVVPLVLPVVEEVAPVSEPPLSSESPLHAARSRTTKSALPTYFNAVPTG